METLYLVILVGTILVLLAAFSSLLAFRFGTPLLLLFLCIGLLAGNDGLGLQFDNGRLAYFVGSLALAVILFDSGFGTSFHAFRQAAAPAITLATIGVLLTAGLFGLAACLVFGFTLVKGLLLGSIVASTDAAAVFFLLRIGGITVRDRVRSTLEVESGSNDPMAIFLTIALVGIATAAPDASSLPIGEVARMFVMEMGLAIVIGLLGGMLIVWLVNRLDMERGLTPIFVVALALLVFSLTGAVGGSGFLAVYIAGLYAGNRRVRNHTAIRRFQEGMTWLAQIVMFLVLGLLATPSQFPAIAVPAITLAVFLMVVARPVAVWLCLAPYRFTNRETLFVSWVGLRGAVSILLAILPAIGGVEGGMVFFNTAFIIVLVSLLLQGWTIGTVARRLGLVVPPQIGPVQKIEVELPGSANHELVAYRVVHDSPVLSGERLPRWARPSLVVRDGRSMRYQYAGRLQENDYVYLFISPNFPHLLDRLFASPAPVDKDDAEFFGAFAVDPRRPVAELEAAYGPGLVPEQELHLTIGELLKQRFGGAVEYADRLRLGPLEIIVRSVDDKGEITSLGVSLDPEPLARPLPPFLRRHVLSGALRRLRGDLKREKDGTAHLESKRAGRQRSTGKAFALARRRMSGILRHRSKASSQRRRPMASFKTLDDLDAVSGKRVLVRVDLNVPVRDGEVTDTTRIERVAPTIHELSGKGARIILLAHFGRPKGKAVPEMSLKMVVRAAEATFGHAVSFAEDCVGEAAAEAVGAMADGDILLLENTRFHTGEERNDPDFAKALAENGDVYVDDAFSAAHRAHASTEGVAHLLPAYAGRAMQAELEALEKGLGNPARPLLAIVGGAKVSTKIDLLNNLVKEVDALVIGGGMANTFLAARGVDVGKSLCEHDLAETAKAIMAEATGAHCAVILPTDAVVARKLEEGADSETVAVSAVPADAMILDVGPQTIEAINAWIGRADTLVWNGPLGAFEVAPFDKATLAAAKYAAERTRQGALVSVAGGGDTVAALNKAGATEDFTYVSTAGGAFLEWMEGKPLPGVEVLKA